MKWGPGLDAWNSDLFPERSDYRKYQPNCLLSQALFVPENFVCPEPCRGRARKVADRARMPGDRMAERNLPTAGAFAYMCAQPAKSCSLGAARSASQEWSPSQPRLECAEYPLTRGLMNGSKINRIYRQRISLHWFDNDPPGFRMGGLTRTTSEHVSLLRKGKVGEPCAGRVQFHSRAQSGYGGRSGGRLMKEAY